MVLTFADWSNYTDQAGNARAIDWTDLRGTPRAAVAEAIRQALVERLGILVTSPAAYLATKAGACPGVAMLLDPIPMGVDLDAVRRLECMTWLLADIATKAGAWDNGYIATPPTSPTPAYVWDTEPGLPADTLSAEWATEMRRILNRCTRIPLRTYMSTTLVLQGGRTDGASGADRQAVGTIAASRIDHTAPGGTTWAAFVAAFAAKAWTPIAWTYEHALCQAGQSVFGTYSARRDRVALTVDARDQAATLYAYVTYAGDAFPEGSPSGFAPDGAAGPSAGAITYTVRDSKALPATGPAPLVSATALANMGLGSACYVLDFGVDGGFTFRP